MSFEEAQILRPLSMLMAQMLWCWSKQLTEGKAWHALGYGSWEKYVRAEFDLSRYGHTGILDPFKLSQRLKQFVPDGTTVVLSEAAAR